MKNAEYNLNPRPCSEYHIGQKIKLKVDWGDRKAGEIAEIVDIDLNDRFIPIQIKTHKGEARFISEYKFELLPMGQSKVVITSNGKETKARLIEGKAVLREATAKCSDKDTFDFETGAKLAFERLFGKEEPKKIEPQVGKNYIAKEDCTNFIGGVVLKAGDIVTVKKIGNTTVFAHGFSRSEDKFTDGINIRLIHTHQIQCVLEAGFRIAHRLLADDPVDRRAIAHLS